MKVSVVIPNWNGQKLLEKNLPALIGAKPDEIIVVDNGSGDDSVPFLEKNYPQVQILKHPQNLGFAVACNHGVKISKGEIVVLLNNDVVPEQNFLVETLPLFKDWHVFAVSFHEPQWSWAKIEWINGYIEHEPGAKTKDSHYSAWASGGSSAFRKSIWEELGGFDTLYHPFYWEDIDLSYRAWKRGYTVLWEPGAIVSHKHEGTIGKYFSKNYIQFISERNRLLFIWKNISDSYLINDHKRSLLKRLIIEPKYWRSFLAALWLFPQARQRRREEIQAQKVSDVEIFKKFQSSG